MSYACDPREDVSMLEACSARWGRDAMVLARVELERQRRGWATKFGIRIRRHTTRLDELPTAHA